jgi:hypothetical protein
MGEGGGEGDSERGREGGREGLGGMGGTLAGALEGCCRRRGGPARPGDLDGMRSFGLRSLIGSISNILPALALACDEVGHPARYWGIPDIGYFPISGPVKKCPDIGKDIRIYGYRDICPNIGTCQETRWICEAICIICNIISFYMYNIHKMQTDIPYAEYEK